MDLDKQSSANGSPVFRLVRLEVFDIPVCKRHLGFSPTPDFFTNTLAVVHHHFHQHS
jgi:hypothetical protein